jgi:hypothetical protein
MSAQLQLGFLGDVSAEQTARSLLALIEDMLRIPNPA